MGKRRIWMGAFLAVFFWSLSVAGVCGAEEITAPYFVIQDEDSLLECFPLKATDVVTYMNGMIAETYVTQTYVNQGDIPINGRYVFPTASGVTVHGMKMTIGNQVVTAQIKEKEEAKEEYETAKSEGKSASLLEQKRPNVFTMDVANIMPGDVVCIELHYTELITPAEGIYEFVFPTVVGPRYVEDTGKGEEAPEESGENEVDSSERSSEGNEVDSSERPSEGNEVDSSERPLEGNEDSWAASPYLPEGTVPQGEYHITVNLSTGVPVTDISCKTHEIKTERKGDSEVRITLANQEDYAGNRDFILKYKLAGENVSSGLVLTEGEEENYFMLTVQPPEHYEPEEIPSREYIFVLDVSGSMIGYPLDTAKSLIRDLVTGLRETDKFNLVLFANDTTLLSEESLPANGWNIKTAMELIQEQQGGGGTSMAPALEEAIAVPLDEEAARSIVIITDGYISNDSEIIDMVNQNMDTASFFSFGIGSSVNDYLIKGIAGAGLGEAFIVTDEEDAAEAVQNFRTYIEAPLLTGITVDYGGFQVYDVEPSVPSILFAQRPIVLFGKWRGEPSGTITVSGKSGQQDYVQKIPVADVKPAAEGEAVRYLWARTRLDRLAGYGSVRNDASVKEEITQLGLEYNMTTPYTSFVAVVEEVRNPEGNSQDVDQALPLPLHVTNLAVGGGYSAYSEPGDAALILLAVCVVVLCIFGRRGKAYRESRKAYGKAYKKGV